MSTDRESEGDRTDDERPPPGVGAMAIARWILLGVAGALALFMWLSYGRAELERRATSGEARAATYQCPMHPQIVSDAPGECPICHMALEPIAKGRGSTTDSGAASEAASGFTCPMHPAVHSEAPGRCPICKMALEPDHDAAAPGGAGGAVPPGTTTVELALDRVQAIGVRTSLVEERAGGGVLRVTAVVLPPEQGAAEVHARTAGFVEAIHVDQTGGRVGVGQAMLSLYSPELLQAQNELLAVRGWSGDAGAIGTSARRKLELLGMAPSEIDRVVAKGEPLRAITIASPASGFVTKKSVVLGSHVTPEMTLYEIQDLSRVYVVADVFLPDIAAVSVGSEARFVPAGHPERATTAKVDLVYPSVTPEARTRRVRMQVKNDHGTTFAPGEYGTVEVATASRTRVAIARDALVDTGTATYVFVVAGEGRYVPRLVTVAGSDLDRVIVDRGLAPGERVVSGATFLIDSESRLRASISAAGAQKQP